MKVLLVNDDATEERELRRVTGLLPAVAQTSSVNCLADALHTLESEGPFDLAVVNLHCIGVDEVRQLRDVESELRVLAFSFPAPVQDHWQVSGSRQGQPQMRERGKLQAERASQAERTLQAERLHTATLMPNSEKSNVSCLAQRRIGAAASSEDDTPHLTRRQLQVLELISEGHPSKTIARALDIAVGTVKVHTTAIFRELDVGNRTQAARKARALLGERFGQTVAVSSGARSADVVSLVGRAGR